MSTSEDILRSQNESLRKTIVAHGLRITDLQAEVARLRTALLAWKIECAAFSLHDGESQIERTRAARIESRINGILEGQ